MKNLTNPRHQSRIIVLQKLFESEFNNDSSFDLKALKEINDIDTNSIDEEYITTLQKGISENRYLIDNKIKEFAQKRTFDDTAKVDIMILRIAIFEMLFSNIKVPLKVIIDESVELAKEFSGKNSFSFINGVLAKISESKEDGKI